MAITILQGDCRAVAAMLPAEHFHCVVTSIPYWGLRAYGTEPQVWGATDPDCRHEWGAVLSTRRRGQAAGETATVGNTTKRVCPPEIQQGTFCRHCGAWLGELGSEPSLSLFVAHVVEVFRAIRRVMRDDATLWLNVGDCYATTPNGRSAADTKRVGADNRTFRDKPTSTVVDGLKPKDLAMAPARVALALQADGWLLRSQIVWTKLAPMPESLGGTHWERCRVKVEKGAAVASGAKPASHPNRTVAGFNERWAASQKGLSGWRVGDGDHREYGRYDNSDSVLAEWQDCSGCPKCAPHGGYVLRWDSGRPTTATEMVYLFAVGPKYFYDLEATRVPIASSTIQRASQNNGYPVYNGNRQRGFPGAAQTLDANRFDSTSGRNLWNWWAIPPEPSRDEHYAAYPTELVRRCLAAGTSEHGCCPTCGAPWARIVERVYTNPGGRQTNGPRSVQNREHTAGFPVRLEKQSTTLGWRPTCKCPAAPPVPCRVADFFGGSGTTGVVAEQMGLDCTLGELLPKYAEMAERRIRASGPLFVEVAKRDAVPEARTLPLFAEVAG